MKKYLFFALIFFGYTFVLNAQTINELQIGLAIPQGDFAYDDDYDYDYDYVMSNGYGMATTGFSCGYKLLSPLKVDGLYWTLNAKIIYNDLQSDFKEYLEDDLFYDADDYSLVKYLNVPIFVGLQYEKSISDALNLYGEAGFGLNILKLTKLSSEEDDFEGAITFNPSIKLGFKVGAGIVFKDKYTISLNYLGLGSHKVEYEVEYSYDGEESEGDDGKFDEYLSVSTLNLTFGFRF